MLIYICTRPTNTIISYYIFPQMPQKHISKQGAGNCTTWRLHRCAFPCIHKVHLICIVNEVTYMRHHLLRFVNHLLRQVKLRSSTSGMMQRSCVADTFINTYNLVACHASSRRAHDDLQTRLPVSSRWHAPDDKTIPVRCVGATGCERGWQPTRHRGRQSLFGDVIVSI